EKTLLSSLLVLTVPNWSMTSPGCLALTALMASLEGSTRFWASRSSPVSWKSTRTEWPSSETGASPLRGETTFFTSFVKKRWARRAWGGRVSGGFRSGAEEHQHREHASRLASAGGQPELPEDGRDVLLDRTQADHQLVRDALVGAAGGHQLEDLPLARRELGERVVAAPPREQRRDDDRVDGGPAVPDPLDGGDEVLHVAYAVLEQIADTLRGVGEELHGEPQLH